MCVDIVIEYLGVIVDILVIFAKIFGYRGEILYICENVLGLDLKMIYEWFGVVLVLFHAQ